MVFYILCGIQRFSLFQMLLSYVGQLNPYHDIAEHFVHDSFLRHVVALYDGPAPLQQHTALLVGVQPLAAQDEPGPALYYVGHGYFYVQGQLNLNTNVKQCGNLYLMEQTRFSFNVLCFIKCLPRILTDEAFIRIYILVA